MKQLFDHYDANGNPVDRWGNIITAQDGDSIRVPLMMMDEQQRTVAQEQNMQDAKTINLKMTPSAVKDAIRKHLPGWQLTRDGEGPDAERAGKQAETARDSYNAGMADAEQDAMAAHEARLANGYRDTASHTNAGNAASGYEAQLTNGWK